MSFLWAYGCKFVASICVKQKETCICHLVADGGDLVPVCRALAKEVSRTGKDPATGATLPGRWGYGSPYITLL